MIKLYYQEKNKKRTFEARYRASYADDRFMDSFVFNRFLPNREK
nr:MAG TPA: hypothetical protein [Caudoviricetes sp.]